MAMYVTLSSNDFIQNSDGTYTATILASTHNMGINYNCIRALRRNSDGSYSSMLSCFTVASNGDFKITVTQPAQVKIGLVAQ